MSDLYLQERKLIALMAQGALEGVRFKYQVESTSGELSLWFVFNEKFFYASRSLYDEHLNVKTWPKKADAILFLKNIGYTGEVKEDVISMPNPENEDHLLKRAEHTQDYNQFKTAESLAAELVFSEFADRFNAIEDVQENSELRKEITDEIALLISKALEFWPNRK